MSLDQKIFDRIRIRPDAETVLRASEPACEYEGCDKAGTHRAPKGRRQEGAYWRFCLDHVRLYNKSYNYFAGLDDDAIAAYQKDSLTGHRPTWSMGVNPDGEKRDEVHRHRGRDFGGAFSDPFEMFRGYSARERAAAPEPPERKLKTLEQRSFETLDLEGRERGAEIKARYKALVKRLHPDANGGDRSSEDRLREIIQAYNYLKSAGFC